MNESQVAWLLFFIRQMPAELQDRQRFVEGHGETIRTALILLWRLIPSYSGARLRVNLKKLSDILTTIKCYVQDEQRSTLEWVDTDLVAPLRPNEHGSLRELVRDMLDREDLEKIKAGIVQLEQHLELFRHPDLEDAIQDVIGFAGDVILLSMGDKALKKA